MGLYLIVTTMMSVGNACYLNLGALCAGFSLSVPALERVKQVLSKYINGDLVGFYGRGPHHPPITDNPHKHLL